jgi:hypothetical protein
LNILAFLDPDNIQKEMLVDEHEDPILEMLHSAEAGRYVQYRIQGEMIWLMLLQNQTDGRTIKPAKAYHH